MMRWNQVKSVLNSYLSVTKHLKLERRGAFGDQATGVQLHSMPCPVALLKFARWNPIYSISHKKGNLIIWGTSNNQVLHLDKTKYEVSNKDIIPPSLIDP